MNYVWTEDVEIVGSSVECWQCCTAASVRRFTACGRSVWQVVCSCGTRGSQQLSREEAENSYRAGSMGTIGSARRDAFFAGITDDWVENWSRFLMPIEQETIASEHLLRDEKSGFVYVMADLANREVKIGGTNRLPGDRWKEHPRGLIPIMAIATKNWRVTERVAHQQLAGRRTSREEYFGASIPLAVQVVLSAVAVTGSAMPDVGFAGHFESLEEEQ